MGLFIEKLFPERSASLSPQKPTLKRMLVSGWGYTVSTADYEKQRQAAQKDRRFQEGHPEQDQVHEPDD